MSLESGPINGQLPEPKTTNNASLAAFFLIVGIRFTSYEGTIFPGFNLYSDKFLQAKGYKNKSRTVAITELWRSGIPGTIVYQFERAKDSTVIKEAVAGWSQMSEMMDKADSANPDAIAGITTLSGVSVKQAAMICCQFAKTKKELTEFTGPNRTIAPIWRRRDGSGNLYMPACKAIASNVHSETEGSGSTARTIVYGSMKLESVKV